MDTLSIFQTLYTTTYRHLLSEAGLKGLLGAYPFIQQIWNLRRTDEVRIALVVRRHIPAQVLYDLCCYAGLSRLLFFQGLPSKARSPLK
jgi:hypothetical protein